MFISVVSVFAFFLRFVYGPLKKRDFRENATGKERPDLSFLVGADALNLWPL